MAWNEQDVYETRMVFSGMDEAAAAEAAMYKYLGTLREEADALKVADLAQADLAQALKATATVTAEASAQAGNAFGAMQGKLQMFAYTLDDAQYLFQNGMGLRPIVNNLMMFSPQLGIAALAVDQLIRHIDLGIGTTKEYGSALEELTAKVKELEARPPQDCDRLQQPRRCRTATEATQGRIGRVRGRREGQDLDARAGRQGRPRGDRRARRRDR